ncbi:hypothetical protein F5Y04DRAFT_266649 [Hypomontagnella monticulosa]|nr:hypothetical protein F5Y04DRAFT_266649 [Hypomontagnella monticulosa]
MAPSSTQLVGTTFTNITNLFQEAVSFNPRSKRQLVILYCLSGIQAEEAIFKNAVQRLLETDQLFNEIEWSTAENLLKSKLGAQYMVYNDSIERLLAGVSTLRILTDPNYSKTDRTEIYNTQVLPTAWEWTEDKYDRFTLTVLDIDKSVEKQIQILRDVNHKLNSIKGEKGTSLRKEFKRFDKMRNKLSDAASVLGPNFGFDCPCRQKHTVYLKIPEWPQSQGQVADERFSLLFHNQADNCAWKYIEMSSDVKQGGNIHESEQDKIHEGGTDRRVRFAGDELETQEGTGFITINVQKEPIRRLPTEATTKCISSSEITELASLPNLCEYIASHQEQDSEPSKVNIAINALGLSLRMTPIAKLESPSPHLPLELHSGHHDRQSLTTLDRLKMSTQVASGVLCLYATPWLADFWSYKDIYFLHDSYYVKLNSWTVESRTAGAPSQAEDDPSTSFTNPTILSLCRFLVELWFGAPWLRIREVYGSYHPLGEREAVVDRDVIETILSWVSDETISPHDRPFHEEGRLYADAVRNCLKCDFGQAKTSMTDQTFRKGVYNKILYPLRWASEEFQSAQHQLFGATQESVTAGGTVEGLVSGVALYDDDSDTDDSKDSKTDKWFKSYLNIKKVIKRIRTDRPKKPDQRVRVAVLDTGVDVSDSLLNPFAIKRRIIYRDFTQPGLYSILPKDEVGHGTRVCGVLLTIADNIDVYAARVSVDGNCWNGSQVAEAIKWAVQDKQVHIISISFGFPYTTRHVDHIRRAILEANAADVLIFASASNKGGNQPVAFPARMDEVICVGSTDGKGAISNFTPNLHCPDLHCYKRLCALGERIESSWPPKLLKGGAGLPRKSGTSFASPIAAGVAAIVLDYMWEFKDHVEYKHHIPKLLTRRGMLLVFELMVEKYSTYDYLVPWKLFNFQVSGDLDENEYEDTMDINMAEVVDIARGSEPGMGIVQKIVGILRIL